MTDRLDANSIQGDFGEQWVQAVASACGILHGRPTTLDLEKADVELVLPGEHAGTSNPTVKAQVKTTVNLRAGEGRTLAYDLDLGTYNVLRRTDHSVARLLIVIGLSEDGERVRTTAEGTLLVGQAAWLSLEGFPESRNETQQVVHLPLRNTLDQEGLERMLITHGTRRSTPVPSIDPWELA